jgi:hypothetical protein
MARVEWMIGYEVVRSIVFYAFWEPIALEGVAMTAAKWFPRHMPLAVVSLALNGGMLHHSGQGCDFYLPSGQARNMRLGQAPFTSFIPIPDLGLAGAAATTAADTHVAEVESARILAFLGRARTRSVASPSAEAVQL